MTPAALFVLHLVAAPAEATPRPAGWWDLGETTPAALQRDVEAAGGIAFRADVPLHFIDHGEMVRYVGEVVETEYPRERASADERLLVAFDLLDPGSDLRTLRRRLLEDNIAGFYDERPDRRRLYAVTDDRRLAGLNQLILAHELRHALQDQHAAVHEVLPPSVGDFDDRRLAYLSLLEGDATLVMERVFLAKVGEEGRRMLPGLSTPPLPDAPPVLRDQLTLPYAIGHPFVRALVERSGWEKVKEAWSRPPESTEQVLHPERYFAGEAPRPVSLPAPPKGGRAIDEGVLGEAFVRTLLGEGGEAAAEGWGGDRFEVWDVSGRTLLQWAVRWDSAAEAQEFWNALLERYRRRHVDEGTREGFRVFRNGLYRRALRLRGDEVRLVASDHRRAFDRALRPAGR